MDARTLLVEFFYRVPFIQPALPKSAVIPGVFTNGECDALGPESEKLLLFRRHEVSSLIEDIIGRQQHFALPKHNLALIDHGSAIEGLLSRGRSHFAGVPDDER